MKDISLHLTHGNMEGIVQCTWTPGGAGSCVYRVPRSLLPACDCSRMPELKQAGVYFLLEENKGQTRVYVGQGGNRKNGEGVLARVLRHEKDALKDCWSTAIICIGFQLSKDCLDYLEQELYQKASSANPTPGCLLNRKVPRCPHVPQMVMTSMNAYINDVELVLGVLGCKVLKQGTLPPPPPHKLSLSRKIDKGRWDVKAEGEWRQDGQFWVLKNSILAPVQANRDCLSKPQRELREKYCMQDKLTILKKDIPFTSLSSAASFVVGNHVNGKEYWR